MTGFFRSMAGRVFIILVAGVLLATALSSWLAAMDRQRTIAQFRQARLLDQAELFIVTLDAIPSEGRRAFLNTSRRFGLQAEMLAKMPTQTLAATPEVPLSDDFVKSLNEQLGAEYLLAPLARTQPQCEAVRPRDKLIEDLEHTQTIVREGLELARSMNTGEPFQLLDLDSLLDSACTDAVDAGQLVSLEGKANAFLLARPAALRRCLTNLLDNAAKYGQQATVQVSPKMQGNEPWIAIAIRDCGPGLGLTIARNLAHQQGGDIRLRNHPEGGLEATLLLPCAH